MVQLMIATLTEGARLLQKLLALALPQQNVGRKYMDPKRGFYRYTGYRAEPPSTHNTSLTFRDVTCSGHHLSTCGG